MARLTAALAMLTLAAPLAGCISPPPAADATGCHGEAWTETRLFLGRGLPSDRVQGRDGAVTERQWREFVDAEVTNRLTDGFTVLDGVGFWRDPATGRSAIEASKVLVVLHPRTGSLDPAVDAISARYLTRFGQTAVLRADQPVCVTFHSRPS